MATIGQITDAISDYYSASEQDPPESSVIALAVQSAVDAINDIRQYGGVLGSDIENKYASLAQRIAIYLCEKEGVEGVTNFSENGISRTFETGDIPPSMLDRVVPICKGW